MTTRNSKHTVAKKTSSIRQQFIPLSGLIGALCSVFSISPNVTTRSSIRLSTIHQSHNIFYTCKFMYQDSRHNSVHMRDVLQIFYTRIDTYNCSVFVLSYNSYHQNHIYIRVRCLANVLDSFIPLIVLSFLRFMPSILLGTHILPNGS